MAKGDKSKLNSVNTEGSPSRQGTSGADRGFVVDALRQIGELLAYDKQISPSISVFMYKNIY